MKHTNIKYMSAIYSGLPTGIHRTEFSIFEDIGNFIYWEITSPMRREFIRSINFPIRREFIRSINL